MAKDNSYLDLLKRPPTKAKAEAAESPTPPAEETKPTKPKSKRGRPKGSSDPVRNFSIGLRQSTVDELDAFVKENGVSRNAFVLFCIKHTMQQVKARKLKLPFEEKRVLKIP